MKQSQLRGVALHLTNSLRATDEKDEPTPVTLYCKGIIVSGQMMSIHAHVVRLMSPAPDEQYGDDPLTSEEKESFAATAKLARRKQSYMAAYTDDEYNTVVVYEALIICGNRMHIASHWVGNLDSIDAYESQLHPKHPDLQKEKE